MDTRTLKPLDVLPVDTKVRIINRPGISRVAANRRAKDQHGNPIYVHLIEFPDGTLRDVNYSFIVPLSPSQHEPL